MRLLFAREFEWPADARIFAFTKARRGGKSGGWLASAKSEYKGRSFMPRGSEGYLGDDDGKYSDQRFFKPALKLCNLPFASTRSTAVVLAPQH